MGEIKTFYHERVSNSAFEECPNCGKYKYATIMRFEYSHWLWSLIDYAHLHIHGEWKDVRKMCDYCGKREKL